MREARRKVPKVAFLHVRDIGAALVVENSDPALPVSHVGPFGSQMPMQFPYAPGGQPHVDPRNGLRDREIRLRYLARPAAVLNAPRRIVERRPKLRQISNISRRWGLRRGGLGSQC